MHFNHYARQSNRQRAVRMAPKCVCVVLLYTRSLLLLLVRPRDKMTPPVTSSDISEYVSKKKETDFSWNRVAAAASATCGCLDVYVWQQRYRLLEQSAVWITMTRIIRGPASLSCCCTEGKKKKKNGWMEKSSFPFLYSCQETRH